MYVHVHSPQLTLPARTHSRTDALEQQEEEALKNDTPVVLGLTNYALPINHLVHWFEVQQIHRKRQDVKA